MILHTSTLCIPLNSCYYKITRLIDDVSIKLNPVHKIDEIQDAQYERENCQLLSSLLPLEITLWS